MIIWRRDNSPPGAGLSKRPSQRRPARQIAPAIPAKISHVGHVVPNALKIHSLPANLLPGPGSLGLTASAAGRHAESA